MEEWEHAVEVLEEVLEKGKSFLFRRQWLKDSTRENIPKDLRLPVDPFVVIDRRFLNHVLERSVAGFFIDPGYAIGRED